MAFKMKGYSGNHGKSPMKKSYKEAYKDADKSKYKTFESFKSAAERYNEKKYGTTQPTAKAKSFGTKKENTSSKVSKPGVASKPVSVKAPEKAAVKPTKMEATGKIKRQDKRRAKKKAIASQAGTSKLEKRLNYAGAKARAKKAARQEKKKNNSPAKKKGCATCAYGKKKCTCM